MASDKNDLSIKDTSGLTDADWAEINRLKSIYEANGLKALSRAIEDLTNKDPVTATRVLGAFFPDEMREGIRDEMARIGMTREDLEELVRKLEGSERKH